MQTKSNHTLHFPHTTAGRLSQHFRYWPADHPGPELRHIEAGTVLQADSGFACLGIGARVTVRASRRFGSNPIKTDLFVPCRCGRHYLTPDDTGRIDGFIIVTELRCAA